MSKRYEWHFLEEEIEVKSAMGYLIALPVGRRLAGMVWWCVCCDPTLAARHTHGHGPFEDTLMSSSKIEDGLLLFCVH